jgi:hypothetical protein
MLVLFLTQPTGNMLPARGRIYAPAARVDKSPPMVCGIRGRCNNAAQCGHARTILYLKLRATAMMVVAG